MAIELNVPSVGSTSWGSDVNENWSKIEAALNAARYQNALINGGFDFAQRQTPTTLTTIADNAYSADRWKITRKNAGLQYQSQDGTGESGIKEKVLYPGGASEYFAYDLLDRLTSQTDRGAFVTTFGYDLNGNRDRLLDTRGFATYFGFDALNRNTAVLGALGQVIYYEYDPNGNLSRKRDHVQVGSEALTYYRYDAANRLEAVMDALGRATYFDLDEMGQPSSVRRPGGGTTNYKYDALNRLSQTTSPTGGVARNFYDETSNLSKIVNARGYAAYFGFDGLGRQVKTLDAEGGSAYFGYDAPGNLARTVGVRWQEGGSFADVTAYFEFDQLNRPSKTIDPLGNAIERFYDTPGNLYSVKPPVGGSAYFFYDARSLQTESVDGVGNASYFAYDQAANRTRVRSPRGFVSYFGYDALNRSARVLDAEGGSAYFGYDVGGNLSRTLDALARATYFEFDKLDRLTSVKDALLQSVYYFYDQAGNRAVERDALARSTYYFYDLSDRLSVARDPLGVASYYVYDENGNLAQTVDGQGVPTAFGYDGLDRRTRILYGQSTTGYGSQQYGSSIYGASDVVETQYFAYDAAGNLVRTGDAWGAQTFAYDALDRPSRRATPRPDAVYYGYDANSSLTRLQYPQGLAACYYGYDGANRMEKLRSPAGLPGYFTYDAAGNVTKKLLGNGAVSWAAFDGADRMVSLRYAKSNGAPLVYFEYGRDAAGRILRIGREGDLNIYYQFDEIDRLTSETWRRRSDHGQIYAFTYEYDAANNRLKMRREFAAGSEWDSAYYAYNAANELTQRRVQTPPATFENTYYFYNANGDMTKEWVPATPATTYYEYGRNRLISRIVPPSGNPWSFWYDANLQRYAIDQGGTPAYYLWDGLNQLEERGADGALKARSAHGYTRLPGIGSTAEVERIAASTTYYQYPLMDHRGTVHAVADSAEALQLVYTQDAFGRELAPVGGTNPSVPNELIYQTNWKTMMVGERRLCWSLYRVFDPVLGIFLQKDFLDYPNKYRAFSNNPVAHVDKDGKEISVLDNPEFVRQVGEAIKDKDNTAKYYIGQIEVNTERAASTTSPYWQNWFTEQAKQAEYNLRHHVGTNVLNIPDRVLMHYDIDKKLHTSGFEGLSLDEQNFLHDLRQERAFYEGTTASLTAHVQGQTGHETRVGGPSPGQRWADYIQENAQYASDYYLKERNLVGRGLSIAGSGLGDLFRVGSSTGTVLSDWERGVHIGPLDVADVSQDIGRAAQLFLLLGSLAPRIPTSTPNKIFIYTQRPGGWQGTIAHINYYNHAVWGSSRSLGPWIYQPGLWNSIMRIWYTGRIQPFTGVRVVSGHTLELFARPFPVGALNLWKLLAHQFRAIRPGSLVPDQIVIVVVAELRMY